MNGAHLKPLDRNDMKPKIGVQWNPLINTAKPHDSTVSAASRKSTCDKGSGSIAKRSQETCDDFLQSWRTIADHSEKFTYVWNLRWANCETRKDIVNYISDMFLLFYYFILETTYNITFFGWKSHRLSSVILQMRVCSIRQRWII